MGAATIHLLHDIKCPGMTTPVSGPSRGFDEIHCDSPHVKFKRHLRAFDAITNRHLSCSEKIGWGAKKPLTAINDGGSILTYERSTGSRKSNGIRSHSEKTRGGEGAHAYGQSTIQCDWKESQDGHA